MKANRNNNNHKEDYEIGKYTISVAEKLTGAHAHHIRRLSRAGLLNPERTDAGQRLFSDADMDTLKEVTALEVEGINLNGIKAILEMRRGERT